MPVNRLLKNLKPGPLNNDQGIAAMLGTVIVIVVMGTIAFTFLAETEKKQAGGAVTYGSINALMTAEAGLRYTEKCLLETDAGCPADTQGNSDWTTGLTNFSKDFGKGSFTIAYTTIDADNVRVSSTGTVIEAIRVLSKNISRVEECPFEDNSITWCTSLTINNNSTTDGPTEGGECPATPLVDTLYPDSFPDDPTTCPNTEYPDFDPGTHLNGSDELTQFQFCSMEIDGSDVVNIPSGGGTIWVAKDLDIKNLAELNAVDTVTFNVGGNIMIQNLGEITVAGALTLHTDGDFTLQNSAKDNQINGDAADMIANVVGNAEIKNSTTFVGGLIANGDVTLQNNADFTGSVIGDNVTLKNSATIVYDSGAGEDTEGIEDCTLGDPQPPEWGEG